MKTIVEGVTNGNLPWALVVTGVFIAIIGEVLGLPVLPVAIGVYLPVSLNACIMIGGLIRLFVDKMRRSEEEKQAITNDGILFCSGMIAGEGLVGILLAFLAVFGVSEALDLSGKIGLNATDSVVSGILFIGIMVLSVLMFSVFKKRKKVK